MTLQEAPDRGGWGATGILVRAMKKGGGWGSVDIAHLDRVSLMAWLAAKEDRAAKVVALLMGHPPKRADK